MCKFQNRTAKAGLATLGRDRRGEVPLFLTPHALNSASPRWRLQARLPGSLADSHLASGGVTPARAGVILRPDCGGGLRAARILASADAL